MYKIKKYFYSNYQKILGIQIFRYLLVGGIATIIDWSVFFSLTELGLYYLFALWISFILATTVHFILSKYFTFKCNSSKIKTQAATHFAVSLITLFLSTGLMYIFVDVFWFVPMYSKIVTTLLLTVVNYSLHKFITFGRFIKQG